MVYVSTEVEIYVTVGYNQMINNTNNDYFTIKKDTPILLFGYTQWAKKIADFLLKKSYCVKGYIDNRAKEIVHDGNYPVYLLKELGVLDWSKEVVVIICLQNIRSQLKVAEQIQGEGLKKIIFAPDTKAFDLSMASEMRKIYQKVCLGEELQGKLIPKYDAMYGRKNSIEIINEFEQHFCILCPIHLIYTGKKTSKNSWLIKSPEIYTKFVKMYEDKNITLNKLYSSFFNYVMTGEGECDVYIDVFAKMTKQNKENYFRDRTELFKLYEREYESCNNFFAETAARATWNPWGYFNLTDGHHRVSYLQKRGNISIPIIISDKDFTSYYNHKTDQKLKKFLSDNNFSEIPNAEIQMRYFKDGKFNYQIKKLIAIWEFLDENSNFENNSYLDASGSAGFFGINMKRMHANCVEIVSMNTLNEKLLSLVLELTYQDNIVLTKKDKINREYDAIFVEDICETEDDIISLYEKTKSFFFIDCKKNNIGLRERINKTKAADYKKLMEYFNGTDWMECGCFQVL